MSDATTEHPQDENLTELVRAVYPELNGVYAVRDNYGPMDAYDRLWELLDRSDDEKR